MTHTTPSLEGVRNAVSAFDALTLEQVPAALAERTQAGFDSAPPSALGSIKLSTENAKWRCISSLQKAVRRGHVANAKAMASALINSDQGEHLLNRLPIIGMEDVAFGDPLLCAEVFAFSSSVAYRKALGGWPTLLSLVERLCLAYKDRLPCEIAVSSSYSPLDDAAKVAVLGWSDERRFAVATDPSAAFNLRWLSLRGMSGQLTVDGAVQTSARNIANFRAAFANQPMLLQYMAQRAATKGELAGLTTGMLLGWQMLVNHPDADPLELEAHDFTPNVCKAVLVEALDMHNYEGKRAYQRLLKTSEGKAFAAWVESRGGDPLLALSNAMFMAESKLCDRRLMSADFDHFRQLSHKAQMEKSCLPHDELGTLLARAQALKPKLDELRVEVLTG